MKKSSLPIIALALTGIMATSAATAPAFAAPGNQNSDRAEYSEQRGGKSKYEQRREHMGERKGGRMGDRMGEHRGGLLALVCSAESAERLETMLERMGSRIDLSAEQQTLFDTFKTDALLAQTNFADNCVEPAKFAGDDEGDDTTADETADNASVAPSSPIDRMITQQTNMRAMADAMDLVLPSAEAFFNSLTDEQLADLRPHRDHGPRR